MDGDGTALTISARPFSGRSGLASPVAARARPLAVGECASHKDLIEKQGTWSEPDGSAGDAGQTAAELLEARPENSPVGWRPTRHQFKVGNLGRVNAV